MKVSDIIQYLQAIKQNLSAEVQDAEDYSVVQYLLTHVFITERSFENISLSDFELLETMFSERWERIKFNKQSYVSSSDQGKKEWVNLAKQICADSDSLYSDYLSLLMPTIENFDRKDSVTLETIRDLPLQTLLISDDGKSMMCLTSAVRTAEAHAGVLSVFCDGVQHAFTGKEIKRFQNTNPDLWNSFQKVKEHVESDEGVRISRSTVYKLIDLVEKSVFETGVVGDYVDIEQQAAEKAYYAFLEYLQTLSKQENDNLMAQVIRRDGGAKTFGPIWLDALGEKDLCITWLARDICQLIKDYMPNYEFKNTTLANWSRLDRMKQNSQEKLFADHDVFSQFESADEYYKQHLIRLASDILTRNFNISYRGGRKISYYGINNRVPNTAYDIFQKIVLALREKNYTESYFSIQNEIVGISIRKRSYARDPETQLWLENIYNGWFDWHKPVDFEQYIALNFSTLSALKMHTCALNVELFQLQKSATRLLFNSDRMTEEGRTMQAAILFGQSSSLFYSLLDRIVEHAIKAEIAKKSTTETPHIEDLSSKQLVQRAKYLKFVLSCNHENANNEIVSNGGLSHIIDFLSDSLLNKLCQGRSISHFFEASVDSQHNSIDRYKIRKICTEELSSFKGSHKELLVEIYNLLIDLKDVNWSKRGLEEAKIFVKQFVEDSVLDKSLKLVKLSCGKEIASDLQEESVGKKLVVV